MVSPLDITHGTNISNTNMLLNDTDPLTMLYNTSITIDKPPWSLLEKMLFGTWLSISMLCAIFGNLMVIVVVIRHKGMQTRTNMFLVNLAVADFLVGILLAPFSLTTLISETWIFGDVLCKLNGFLNAICFITSIHTLMYISIHKYVSITRPFSRILNHVKILVMISCAWIWSIVCAILTMFIFSNVIYKPGTMQCGPEYPKNSLEYLNHLIIQVTNILIPLAIMVFAYVRMFCEFRQHAIRMRKNTTLQSDQILGQQIRVTKTLFIVLACYMSCWLPYAAYSTYVSMVKDKSQIPGWANVAAYCFMYMNSGCNPVIYAWRSPSFREGYKQILCQKSAYIVSDDTIRESESPSIIRRLSTLLHTSFRQTRFSSRRNSEDCSSVNSLHISRNLSIEKSPSHTLLKRATSKTAKGSSIIKKDGSLILTKNGKIISVRRDFDSLKRDKSFSAFDQLSPSTPTNGLSSKSMSDIHTMHGERIELTPLLRRDHGLKTSPSHSLHSSSSAELCGHNFYHASLSKIDSVDETETELPKVNNDQLVPPSRPESCVLKPISENQQREATLNATNFKLGNHSNSSSIKSDLDDVFIQSPVIITFNSQECALNAMPLEPQFKDINKLARSNLELDARTKSTEELVKGKKVPNKAISKSSNIVFRVPELHRYPSLETLDIPAPIPRCKSDASTIRKLASPLYTRRWLDKNDSKGSNGIISPV